MIDIKFIIGLIMFVVGSVVVGGYFDQSYIPSGVALMIWGWDVGFNHSKKPVEPTKHLSENRKPSMSRELIGTAGEDLECGDCVIFGEDGKIYKAKQYPGENDYIKDRDGTPISSKDLFDFTEYQHKLLNKKL